MNGAQLREVGMLLVLCRKSLRYQWGCLDHLLRAIDMMWFGVKGSFLRTRITRSLLTHLLCHCPVPSIIFLLMKGMVSSVSAALSVWVHSTVFLFGRSEICETNTFCGMWCAAENE